MCGALSGAQTRIHFRGALTSGSARGAGRSVADLLLLAREDENLARIDQVGITDLLLVRPVDHGVAITFAVDPLADAPEIVAARHDGRVDVRNHDHRSGI